MFSSFLSMDLYNFLKNDGIFLTTNCIREGAYSDYYSSLMGIKYIITTSDRDIYKYDNNLKLEYQNEYYSLYKNPDSLSLGFAVDSSIKETVFSNSVFNNYNDIAGKMNSITPVFTETVPQYGIYTEGSEFLFGDTDYFNIQQTLSELVTSGFVEKVMIRNTSYYSITGEGYTSLTFFKNQIPRGALEDINSFLDAHKNALKNEVGTQSDYYKHIDGDYIAHCKVSEGKSLLYEINV